jgi:3-hydroxyacyl-CoA dehydrogenase/enoyl-CoA hydratase/3-hydroxybutyryl-CoA epimerase
VALKDPSRLIGIHFFNPVAKMPLVEVVKGRFRCGGMQARPAFVRKIDKLALPVKSAPGFLVNAVLGALHAGGDALRRRRHRARGGRRAALAFGMPMGPIELADTVGPGHRRRRRQGPGGRRRRAAGAAAEAGR